MKFTEIALITIMITLSLSAMSTLNIIPNGHDSVPLHMDSSTITGLNNQTYMVNETTGEIECVGNATKNDVICKVYYLEDQTWGGANTITDTSDTFGFSDIISGANMLSNTIFIFH